MSVKADKLGFEAVQLRVPKKTWFKKILNCNTVPCISTSLFSFFLSTNHAKYQRFTY
uniref:Uncharacterized protein n=1 Tax=Lepeophtheirus salmonis TaxID=72036 RepID=A0A0K2TLQ6_LEPSM